MTTLEQMTQLVREIEALKSRLERAESMRPQYEILSMSARVTITADQNNFALASYDYDCVFIEPSGADRTINGMTGGVNGRHLLVRNQSALNLLFTHQNAGATAENRIITTSGATVTLALRRWAEFVYTTDTVLGGPRWIMIFPAS